VITASLVLYNTSIEDVKNVINSVNNSMIEKLYVIDHSTTDQLSEHVKNATKAVYFHRENKGYGAGHNFAIEKSINEDKAKYHIVLNPDIHFTSKTIESLEKYMDNNSEVGLIMPNVFYPNGEQQFLCKLLPTPFDILFRRILPKWLTRKRDDKFTLKKSGYNKIMNIPYLSGCFMFFRIKALEVVGLFDERYFMYFEDLDISRRMHEIYKTIFYPFVEIIHTHAAGHRKSLKLLKISLVSAIKYYDKWGWICDKNRNETNKQILIEIDEDKWRHD